MPTETRCPCGSGDTYPACCGRFHSGDANAPTAQALMQSRFSAFARSDENYLLQTWHRSTRPASVGLDDGIRWVRLEILEVTGGGLLDSTGSVEFRAHYRAGGNRGELHERSTFVRENGRWFYVTGEIG